MSNFHVGQRVVCVDGDYTPKQLADAFWGDETLPMTGLVYTIRGYMPEPNGLAVRLVEINNEPREYYHGFVECASNASRFRALAYPKQSLESDLHLFTPWLKVGEEA